MDFMRDFAIQRADQIQQVLALLDRPEVIAVAYQLIQFL